MHSFVQIQSMAARRELCYNEMQPIDTTSSSPQSLQSLKELSFAVSAAHTLLSTHHSGVKTGVAWQPGMSQSYSIQDGECALNPVSACDSC